MNQSLSYQPWGLMHIPHQTLLQKAILTTVASIILAIAANISLPLYPVPLSFQTLAVLLVGTTLGRKLGTLAILQTFALGFLGLPVFANGANAYVAIFSPSLGYAIGFIASAYCAGWAAEKGIDRNFFTGLLALAAAHQIIFVFGVVYLSIYMNISLLDSFYVGYVPFIFFDLLKFTAAALIMHALWSYKKHSVR